MKNTCTTYANTGAVSCNFLMKIIARIILVPKFKEDGTPNFIAQADLTKIKLQELFNKADELDRFYPVPLLRNVTNERAENEYFEWDGGGKSFIRQGVRSFLGVIDRGTPELAGRIGKWNGAQMGFYAFDSDGNFIYKESTGDDGDYYPIPIDGGSFDCSFKWATNSEPSWLSVSFDVLNMFKDSDLRYVPAENLDFDGLDTNDVYGLQEIDLNITMATATKLLFTASMDMEAALEGLTNVDILIHNMTTDTDVVVDSLVEDPLIPGSYSAQYAVGATTGDTLALILRKERLSHSTDSMVVS